MRELRASETSWKICLIDGPNMSNLGQRDVRIYGTIGSIQELHELVSSFASSLGVGLETFVSNFEGAILEFIHSTAADADGYIINPAGLTTFSEATRHALWETKRPVIEVHFANIAAHPLRSVFTRSVLGMVMGLRQYSYLGALLALVLALDDESFLGPSERLSLTNRSEGVPFSMFDLR